MVIHVNKRFIPHLFLNGFSRMVYEQFLQCFISKDPSSWFSEVFQIGDVVAHGDTPRLVALVPGVNRLLVKDTNIFHPIDPINPCRNPTLAKCGGEAQHLGKVKSWNPPGLPNV